jgi:hypothetical protein
MKEKMRQENKRLEAQQLGTVMTCFNSPGRLAVLSPVWDLPMIRCSGNQRLGSRYRVALSGPWLLTFIRAKMVSGVSLA